MNGVHVTLCINDEAVNTRCANVSSQSLLLSRSVGAERKLEALPYRFYANVFTIQLLHISTTDSRRLELQVMERTSKHLKSSKWNVAGETCFRVRNLI
jgi:hypothetical protein